MFEQSLFLLPVACCSRCLHQVFPDPAKDARATTPEALARVFGTTEPYL